MDMLEQVTAVGVVLLLLCGTLWWLRRRGVAVIALPGRGNSGRRMETLERLPLGPQHALHLIRLGNTELVVASSPDGCSLLHQQPLINPEVRS